MGLHARPPEEPVQSLPRCQWPVRARPPEAPVQKDCGAGARTAAAPGSASTVEGELSARTAAAAACARTAEGRACASSAPCPRSIRPKVDDITPVAEKARRLAESAGAGGFGLVVGLVSSADDGTANAKCDFGGSGSGQAQQAAANVQMPANVKGRSCSYPAGHTALAVVANTWEQQVQQENEQEFRGGKQGLLT